MAKKEDVLITPENVDEILGETSDAVTSDEEVSAVVESIEETNPEKEVEEVEEVIEETNPEPEIVSHETIDTSVEINGQTYSREELEQIFHVGKSVKDYQTSHPGFDPILLHRDYTKKSERLAQLEKQVQSTSTETPQAFSQSTGKSIEDIATEVGVNPEDVKTVQKIAKALGFVDAREVAQMDQDRFLKDYETVKQQQINEFLAKHPEYHPSQDVGDKNWSALLNEYSLYKTPEDARKYGELLERAHKGLKGSSFEPMSAAKLLAQKKVNNVGKSSSAGGSSSTSSEKTKKGIPSFARENLKGFSEAELEDMFN